MTGEVKGSSQARAQSKSNYDTMMNDLLAIMNKDSQNA